MMKKKRYSRLTTPSYFFLIWRWSMWLYALLVIFVYFRDGNFPSLADGQYASFIAILLLTITFLQTFIITLYAPVLQILLPHFIRRSARNYEANVATPDKRRADRGHGRRTAGPSFFNAKAVLGEDPGLLEGNKVVPPLLQTCNVYWDIAIYSFDVLICGLVTYYSRPFSHPPFGSGSPFYRYGMSTAFAAALAYRYPGGLLAALGYDLFIIFAMLVPAPGGPLHYQPTLIDIAGSLIDTPLAALLAAYLATLLSRYAQSEKENRHLTEQMVKLAAAAERERMAREIHDGFAQHAYMLSLQAETCAALVQKIGDADLVQPLAQRLGKLVSLSKQALWETRTYMFSLKPLLRGTTTLSQMITNQLSEFEAISDLKTSLEIDGLENDQRYAQIAPTLFRIVQEALTNAYKHAEATEIRVHLSLEADHIILEVSDNGRGLPTDGLGAVHCLQFGDNLVRTSAGARPEGQVGEGLQRIYSGHGLNNMCDRAKEMGGTFEILSQPTGGVTISLRLPINTK